MAIALGFNSRALMKTLDSQCDYNNEKAPTIASCRINGVRTNNGFVLAPILLIIMVVGSIVSLGRFIGRN
jgi:hypothetical protein